ncbi:MAG: hypothetical protein JWM78_2949 [Verrucomicrobiaceae bacterium]|nr:hypothetical protein [Verrucomicrobiaceae bacterium]
MKKILFALCLLTSFVAQADTLYQIEIIVFARDSAEAENEENWSKHYDLRYPAQTVMLQAGGDGSATYQSLPADTFQLNKEAAAIGQRRNMRVLAHQAWLQPIEDPTRAKSIFISGGKQFGAHHELEGTIALGVEHFLRADANLWLSRFAANGASEGQALPLPPGTMSDSTTSNQIAPTQIVVLQEQRRMRSGELHYFDHPKLGLLILVTRKTEAP